MKNLELTKKALQSDGQYHRVDIFSQMPSGFYSHLSRKSEAK